MPNSGELGLGSDFGILPDFKASLPDSTASFMAKAISTGCLALAIAVFKRTASAPISIAMVASDEVPIPASIITGTETESIIF